MNIRTEVRNAKLLAWGLLGLQGFLLVVQVLTFAAQLSGRSTEAERLASVWRAELLQCQSDPKRTP
jgi:hypothetical protein